MTENNEVPEIGPKKSNKGKWFLGILILTLIIGGAIYIDNYEEINAKFSGVELNKTIEADEICYNETFVLNSLISYENSITFHLINQSSYCNLIPISWTDIDNQTYSTELISINCLKGGDS